MEVLRKELPNRARVRLNRLAIDPGHAQIAQRDALAREHAKDIVIGHNEQLRRVGKAGVLGKPARVAMAMRADDRQVRDLLIECARKVARSRFRGQEAVRVGKAHAQKGPACFNRETDILVCQRCQNYPHLGEMAHKTSPETRLHWRAGRSRRGLLRQIFCDKEDIT